MALLHSLVPRAQVFCFYDHARACIWSSDGGEDYEVDSWDLVFNPEVDRREVILTGFNAINHDHGLHSLTAGPDGKFYFNNGNCGAVFTDKSGRTFYLGGTYGSRGPNWPADHLSTTGKTSSLLRAHSTSISRSGL